MRGALRCRGLRAGAFILILLIGLPFLLAAQESDPDVETDWDDYSSGYYVAGDQVFTMSLGVGFPALFLRNGSVIDPQISPPVGGSGSLAFNFYLNPLLYVGGEIGLMFYPTIGGDTLFLIPLGVRIGTQFIVWRFEFPISFSIGVNWHSLLNDIYFGMYAKIGGAAFFRFNNEWAFGLSANWSWFPEWTKDRSKSVDGFIVDLTISARYHF